MLRSVASDPEEKHKPNRSADTWQVTGGSEEEKNNLREMKMLHLPCTSVSRLKTICSSHPSAGASPGLLPTAKSGAAWIQPRAAEQRNSQGPGQIRGTSDAKLGEGERDRHGKSHTGGF